MFKELFDKTLQDEMTSFFINHLSTLGTKHHLDKGHEINHDNADNIYIVVSGYLKEVLYSTDGNEICFFRLPNGTIFGEMDYFDGYRTCVIVKALENSVLSIVNRDILEKELNKNPKIYVYFLHSIIRKYRLIMLKIADDAFNDSLGKMASTLLRFTALQEGSLKEPVFIDKKYIPTHEELAKYLNCSRTTVTNGLNYFKEQNYIDIKNKTIIINDCEGLKKHVKSIYD
ncbi:Crp/Fnr family transcriptional regulator [Marinisporobacter balticus]|uniref:CRP-like cAMP-binding protein n=1 Tax=Marinisporobacter balticus TaxID=2018667 RepID=A0A4R2KJR7_9FIRM|nr:Crp/Fnr family transcriptional regulator [Marinisporobacter balticus]TCO72677.1 CRP-like cAMP-binding protein [Marinisporobacter balticus]